MLLIRYKLQRLIKLIWLLAHLVRGFLALVLASSAPEWITTMVAASRLSLLRWAAGWIDIYLLLGLLFTSVNHWRRIVELNRVVVCERVFRDLRNIPLLTAVHIVAAWYDLSLLDLAHLAYLSFVLFLCRCQHLSVLVQLLSLLLVRQHPMWQLTLLIALEYINRYVCGAIDW